MAANGNELFYHTIMNQKSEHNYEIDFILVVNWFLNNSIISQTVRRLLILVTKKCRIYAACGVSQTPITLIQKRRLEKLFMKYSVNGLCISKDAYGNQINMCVARNVLKESAVKTI